MPIGKKLKRWRLGLGLTQRQAAARAGVSQAAWQVVESDSAKRIGLDVATKIATSTEGAITLYEIAGIRSPTKAA